MTNDENEKSSNGNGTLVQIMSFQVRTKEVVLEDTDVSNALIVYINTHAINNLVVGSSTRIQAITRSPCKVIVSLVFTLLCALLNGLHY